MTYRNPLPAICPKHGQPKNRDACEGCNAAYMRGYLRRRRVERPALAMWHRAKKRARRLGVPFSLPRDAVIIPQICPVFGTALVVGESRSPHSPSLDRIQPSLGYVAGNCRVISDHANRIKGRLDLARLRAKATLGPPSLRAHYDQVVEYVEREELLAEVRRKAADGGRAGEEWHRIALFLESRFRTGPVR
ncbi:MAG: hypothetical protein U1E24_08090 [Phenylobacterium sp.]|nr:hypothetical protein [Phenylobacterium sp.]